MPSQGRRPAELSWTSCSQCGHAWPPSGGTCEAPQRASWGSSGGSVGWGFGPGPPASPSRCLPPLPLRTSLCTNTSCHAAAMIALESKA
eukprot:scaffold4173_cov29-Tisochrysis_lutea.AAC.1